MFFHGNLEDRQFDPQHWSLWDVQRFAHCPAETAPPPGAQRAAPVAPRECPLCSQQRDAPHGWQMDIPHHSAGRVPQIELRHFPGQESIDCHWCIINRWIIYHYPYPNVIVFFFPSQWSERNRTHTKPGFLWGIKKKGSNDQLYNWISRKAMKLSTSRSLGSLLVSVPLMLRPNIPILQQIVHFAIVFLLSNLETKTQKKMQQQQQQQQPPREPLFGSPSWFRRTECESSLEASRQHPRWGSTYQIGVAGSWIVPPETKLSYV